MDKLTQARISQQKYLLRLVEVQEQIEYLTAVIDKLLEEIEVKNQIIYKLLLKSGPQDKQQFRPGQWYLTDSGGKEEFKNTGLTNYMSEFLKNTQTSAHTFDNKQNNSPWKKFSSSRKPTSSSIQKPETHTKCSKPNITPSQTTNRTLLKTNKQLVESTQVIQQKIESQRSLLFSGKPGSKQKQSQNKKDSPVKTPVYKSPNKTGRIFSKSSLRNEIKDILTIKFDSSTGKKQHQQPIYSDTIRIKMIYN